MVWGENCKEYIEELDWTRFRGGEDCFQVIPHNGQWTEPHREATELNV